MNETALRVLQVGKFYPPHRGGMETHLADLCRALATQFDLDVIVAAEGRRTVHETVDGQALTRLATLATVASTPILPGLPRAIRRFTGDVVHVHLPNPWAMLAYLVSGRRIGLVATHHSDIVRQRGLRSAFEPLLRAFFARCDAILVSSPPYLESSRQLARWRDRCRVVPFGIDVRRFAASQGAEVERLRQLYGPRLVLGIGRHVYYKGFDVLISAMAEVPESRLVLIGDGPRQSDLVSQATTLGLADRVAFVGEVADVVPWLQAAAVFVLPSIARSEAFGIVQLEAMASGTPVVNTALDSGVPWVSRHGESGLTVPPADPGALAAAIRRLLDDEVLRDRLGVGGRRRVMEEFSLETMARRVLETYREAVSAREAG